MLVTAYFAGRGVNRQMRIICSKPLQHSNQHWRPHVGQVKSVSACLAVLQGTYSVSWQYGQ